MIEKPKRYEDRPDLCYNKARNEAIDQYEAWKKQEAEKVCE